MKKYIGYLAFDFDCVIASYNRPFKFDDLGTPNYEVIMDDKAVNYHYKYNKKTKKEMIKEINQILKWNKK